MDDEPKVTVLTPQPEALARATAERPKRKYQRRVPRSPYGKKVRLVPREPEPPPPLAVPPPPKPSPDEAALFAGMTSKTCATGCNPQTGCVITGDICAHPYISGGLQALHRMKPPVLARDAAAKRFLKHQAIELDPYGNQRKEA